MKTGVDSPGDLGGLDCATPRPRPSRTAIIAWSAMRTERLNRASSAYPMTSSPATTAAFWSAPAVHHTNHLVAAEQRGATDDSPAESPW
jgi:hypothetical protein